MRDIAGLARLASMKRGGGAAVAPFAHMSMIMSDS